MACNHCVGFHRCMSRRLGSEQLRWRKGSLHGGYLDAQRALWNLHRKRVPLDKLKQKADEYVEAGRLTQEKAADVVQVIEQERGQFRTTNELGSDGEEVEQREHVSLRLGPAELAAELGKREKLMQAGSTAVTDQWRVYTHIVNSLRSGVPLRLMVQASAGTGKSFLLTTVYLWCIVHGKKAKACAPTGIAAANVDIEGITFHWLYHSVLHKKHAIASYHELIARQAPTSRPPLFMLCWTLTASSRRNWTLRSQGTRRLPHSWPLKSCLSTKRP